jgi:hypothetical protein
VDSELGAAPEHNGVVIEDGRQDEGSPEESRDHESILQLAHLIAEAAVRGVKHVSSAMRKLGRRMRASREATGRGDSEGEERPEEGVENRNGCKADEEAIPP